MTLFRGGKRTKVLREKNEKNKREREREGEGKENLTGERITRNSKCRVIIGGEGFSAKMLCCVREKVSTRKWEREEGRVTEEEKVREMGGGGG